MPAKNNWQQLIILATVSPFIAICLQLECVLSFTFISKVSVFSPKRKSVRHINGVLSDLQAVFTFRCTVTPRRQHIFMYKNLTSCTSQMGLDLGQTFRFHIWFTVNKIYEVCSGTNA